ncbi:hypothetical protein [Kitasatospora sp. NBC_00458]|uniref:hypothetical protein n=1 Tax=Kitasatospora sp. NBC_00458 TaxID=2903568 RepID=UPI002E176A96
MGGTRMLPKTVREAVEAAAVLVEEVGKRVVGTAAGLLEKGGIDVADVERRLGGPFPPSARSLQTLAGEAVTAGRAGVDLAVGVARGEVEKVFEKVGDQVTKVGVVLAYLEGKLREVEEDGAPRQSEPEPAPAPAPRAGGLFENGWEDEAPSAGPGAAGGPGTASGAAVPERIAVDEPVEVDPPVPPNGAQVARRSTAPKAAAPAPGSADEAAGTPGGKAAAGKPAEAPAGKKAAKKAAAGKPAAKKTAAGEGKPAAKKAAARKTAVKKTAVKRTATAKKAQPGEAKQPTGQEPPVKRTATRKTTVRRTTTTKKPEPDA